MTEINIIQCPLAEVRKHLESFGEIFIVYDRNVRAVYEALDITARSSLAIEAAESCKVMDSILNICRWLLDQEADRNAFVLGIGGGITTDMTGFAASIYKRGVRFGFLPTTLLAQVDAAIGGKNGVNLDSYKNMLGIIRQPQMTFVCPEVLGTLPDNDIASGAAELLKTFIIQNDNENYQAAVRLLSARKSAHGSNITTEEFGALIGAAAKVKAGIAGRDPDEHGERRFLNLGHTFAHSIEKKSDEKIAHGHAVSMGIILAAKLAEALPDTGADKGIAARIEADFKACGLPTSCPFRISELAAAMRKDKKAEGGIIHFILPLGIGRVTVKDLTVETATETLSKE